MHRARLLGLALAAGSGVLYGSINVLAKPLELHPFAKGAVAYLVSALVLSPFVVRLRVARGDWPKVVTMGVVGGGVAPLLLFFGLRETAAADTGLLLTAELVATATLAFVFLRERFHAREVAGLACLFLAAATVALASGSGVGASTLRGALLVLGAAVAWAVDNAVSARLVGGYAPPGLIGIKGLLGGGVSLVAWLALSREVPAATWEWAAMAGLGVVSIALSSLLFYYALRLVGAARTSAMNVGTTALIGAAGGAALLGETLRPLHAVALSLVLAGAALLARRQVGASGPL